MPEAPDEGIPAMVLEAIDDAVRLARAEIAYAKAEALAAALRFAVAAAFFAGALLGLLVAAVFALGSVPTFLAGRVFSGWVWWLLTAALLLVLAALAALTGLRRMKRGIGTTTTFVGSLKEDIAWLRGLTKRNVSGS
ncbi:MAG: phage holin family protein [Candidatus Dormibacteria bacterium]